MNQFIGYQLCAYSLNPYNFVRPIRTTSLGIAALRVNPLPGMLSGPST